MNGMLKRPLPLLASLSATGLVCGKIDAMRSGGMSQALLAMKSWRQAFPMLALRSFGGDA